LSPPSHPDRRATAAVKAVKQTEADLQKLRAAADRARDQYWAARQTLADAETTLTGLRDRETARARQAFVDGRPDVSPLPQAEQAVVDAQTELTKIDALEQSIAAEIAATEERLDYQRHQLDEQIGKVLVASPELSALNREIRQVWARLRSLRGAAAALNAAIPYAAPDHALSDWEAVENVNVGDPRDPVDHALIDQWRDAVIALHDDPLAELPGG
jgi:predicted  nucleic acid-binding Zn-ribbon protein